MNDPRIRLSKECIEGLALLGIEDAKGVNWFIMGCLQFAKLVNEEVRDTPTPPPQEKEEPVFLNDNPRVHKYISKNWKYMPEYFRCKMIYDKIKELDWEVYAWAEEGMMNIQDYYEYAWITERVELFMG